MRFLQTNVYHVQHIASAEDTSRHAHKTMSQLLCDGRIHPVDRIQERLDSMRSFAMWFSILLSGMIAAAPIAVGASEQEDHFEKHVRPLLIQRCLKCHSGETVKGGLRLESRESLLKGGETGPAVVQQKPEQSLLIQAVRHQNGLAMPPDGKLTEFQIASLEKWIKQGAVWPGATNPVADSTTACPSVGTGFSGGAA